MRILGISGGLDFPHEDLFRSRLLPANIHDSAAVLLEDGRVVAGLEEERMNRIKNTGKFPVSAIRKCLEARNIQLSDVDKIVYNFAEIQVKYELVAHRQLYRQYSYYDPKALLVERLKHVFGVDFFKENVIFVNHHYCHAASAYYMSGFERSLIMTIDGASMEGNSGIVMSAEGSSLTPLGHISNENSLGAFYVQVIDYLGYWLHDEYKVMGLAPYGDPNRFRRLFKKAYVLLPEGQFKFDKNWFFVLMESIKPRLKGESFTQEHKDVAAALQETLETIVLHILKHYRKETGHTKLCLGGGVAQNCSMNGKILYSGLFDEVFVQPAAHDAGNALGGALYVYRKLRPETAPEKLEYLYWGSETLQDDRLTWLLKRWKKFISFRKSDRIAEEVAARIADGAVIGWVQGRSEFGPRALGNRSILADPRPTKNKKLINEMVKKREGYRPFAPSVLEEYVAEYYEVPWTKASFSFMNYVLGVKPKMQSKLGAVTHVDGTARIQTVSQKTNAKYWNLINEFRKLTGIPILLNTSFNNNAEPIVDSEEDALVCFLTTNIHHLVIGDYIIEKKDIDLADYLDMVLTRPVNSELKKTTDYSFDGDKRTMHVIRLHYGDKYRKEIPESVFQILDHSDGIKTLGELMEQLGYSETSKAELTRDFVELWSLRMVHFQPFGREPADIR